MRKFKRLKKVKENRLKYVEVAAENVPVTGLDEQEVAERAAAGQINGDVNIKTKSVARILRTNIVTFFNVLFAVIAVIMAFFIEPNLNGFTNYGFLLVAIINCLIRKVPNAVVSPGRISAQCVLYIPSSL